MVNKSTTVRLLRIAAKLLRVHSPSETGKEPKTILGFDSSYREEVALADGLEVSLRLLQPTDKEGLAEGFARMSPESRHFRFMGGRNELNERELCYLCDVDGFDHFAIGAAVPSADGDHDGVAVGRFVRLQEQPGVAEPAITVVDDYQGQGLGRILLDRLASAARERGIDRFHCELLASNEKARRLLSNFDERATVRQEGDAVTMELDLRHHGEPRHHLEEVA